MLLEYAGEYIIKSGYAHGRGQYIVNIPQQGIVVIQLSDEKPANRRLPLESTFRHLAVNSTGGDTGDQQIITLRSTQVIAGIFRGCGDIQLSIHAKEVQIHPGLVAEGAKLGIIHDQNAAHLQSLLCYPNSIKI